MVGSSASRVKPKTAIGICCSSAKHTELRSKSKDWLARNQNDVSNWSDMYTRGLLFQWASTIKSNSTCWSSSKQIFTNVTCSCHDIPVAEILLSWYLTTFNHYINDRLMASYQFDILYMDQHTKIAASTVQRYTCSFFFLKRPFIRKQLEFSLHGAL